MQDVVEREAGHVQTGDELYVQSVVCICRPSSNELLRLSAVTWLWPWLGARNTHISFIKGLDSRGLHFHGFLPRRYAAWRFIGCLIDMGCAEAVSSMCCMWRLVARGLEGLPLSKR